MLCSIDSCVNSGLIHTIPLSPCGCTRMSRATMMRMFLSGNPCTNIRVNKVKHCHLESIHEVKCARVNCTSVQNFGDTSEVCIRMYVHAYTYVYCLTELLIKRIVFSCISYIRMYIHIHYVLEQQISICGNN